MIRANSLVLDIGARREKIRSDAISLDIDKDVRPDVCASAGYLPFKSDTFDYVSMLEVIEHLDGEQIDRALVDCQRVANKLIVSTPNCDSKLWALIVWPLWSHTVGREWLGAHKQFFGKKSLEDLFEKDFGMEILSRIYSKWNLLILVETRPAIRAVGKAKGIEIGPEIRPRRPIKKSVSLLTEA